MCRADQAGNLVAARALWSPLNESALLPGGFIGHGGLR
ncbi:hypothetical protein [Azospirillum argentinense]